MGLTTHTTCFVWTKINTQTKAGDQSSHFPFFPTSAGFTDTANPKATGGPLAISHCSAPHNTELRAAQPLCPTAGERATGTQPGPNPSSPRTPSWCWPQGTPSSLLHQTSPASSQGEIQNPLTASATALFMEVVVLCSVQALGHKSSKTQMQMLAWFQIQQ